MGTEIGSFGDAGILPSLKPLVGCEELLHQQESASPVEEGVMGGPKQGMGAGGGGNEGEAAKRLVDGRESAIEILFDNLAQGVSADFLIFSADLFCFEGGL